MRKEIEQKLVIESQDERELALWMERLRDKWDHVRREGLAIQTRTLVRYRKEIGYHDTPGETGVSQRQTTQPM